MAYMLYRERELESRLERGNIAFVYQNVALVVPRWFPDVTGIYPHVSEGRVYIFLIETERGFPALVVMTSISGISKYPSASFARKLVRLERQDIDANDDLYSLDQYELLDDTVQHEVTLDFSYQEQTRDYLNTVEFPLIVQPDDWNYTRPMGKRDYQSMISGLPPKYYPSSEELSNPDEYYAEGGKYY